MLLISKENYLTFYYFFLSDHYYNSYDYIDYIDLELFLSTVYYIFYIYKIEGKVVSLSKIVA